MQVYVSDTVTSVTWADKELKAYRQVDVAPGEPDASTSSCRSRPARSSTRTARIVEPGTFELLVGPSSRDEDLLRRRVRGHGPTLAACTSRSLSARRRPRPRRIPSRDGLDATRATYDTVAIDYARIVTGLDAEGPLTGRCWTLRGPGGRPRRDVGCGTGRLTAYLADLGLDVVGIDLSPGMVAVARRTYPSLRFEVGSMTALDLPDGGVAGCWPGTRSSTRRRRACRRSSRSFGRSSPRRPPAAGLPGRRRRARSMTTRTGTTCAATRGCTRPTPWRRR